MKRQNKAADQIEMQRARKKALVHVADIPLRVAPAVSKADVPHWIANLDMWQSAFLTNWPQRPGAPQLRQARAMTSAIRTALAREDAEAAAWAGMRLMHALWLAQTADAEKIIKASVKRSRGATLANTKRTDDAEQERARLRMRADQIRSASSRPMSNSEIAKKLDPAHWNTIRKII